MAVLEEEKPSIRVPFTIASDEGDIHSEDVIYVRKSGGEHTAHLIRKYGKTYAIVSAPYEVVCDIFREHGYDNVLTEKEYNAEDLERLTAEYKESRKRGPSPDS